MTTFLLALAAILAVSVTFAFGYVLGYSNGRRPLAELQEAYDELGDTLDATMRNFEDYVTDHANTYPPTIWSNAVAPGGQVCAVPIPDMPGAICGYPVESEPCPIHTCRCAHGLLGDDMLTGRCGQERSGL